jgi:2-methylcitrate dehydratase PrpD
MSNSKILETMRKINNNKELKCDAIYHIGECMAVREQITKDKNIVIIAKVNDLEIGLCDNGKFTELLDNEIKQACLCLENKPNKFLEVLSCS